MKRKVLLIARRSTKPEALVRYWPNDKWDLHLYTCRKDEWFPGMSEKLGERWISLFPETTHHTLDGDDPTGNRKKRPKFGNVIKSKTKKARKYIYHKIFRIYDKYFWTWAVPSFSKMKSIIEETRPDLVISFYGPFTANLIARRIAVSQGIPWIAYFRDHCTTFNLMHRLPIIWHVQSIIDRWVHAPVGSLVGVSPQFVDILKSFYKIPASRSHVIAGGFDDRYLPEDIKERCLKRRENQSLSTGEESGQPAVLKVSYAGKLFGHRIEPLVTLLNALEVLLKMGIPCELNITVSNAFYCFPQEIQEMIAKLEGKGLTVISEATEISYVEALRIQESADVNIILEGMRPPHSTAGTLPLKVFDLMMIAKPAIAVCSPSLPIGDYLREAGIGIDCKDAEGIVAGLTEIWEWKQQGKVPSWYLPKGDVIKEYSLCSMAEKMNEISEEVYNRALMAN